MTNLSWRPASDGEAATIVSTNGRVLADYSWSRAKNHPHFRNIRPVAHDGVLSNHAPWDHRWHHGLWWSWKFIDDVLYWEDHEDFGGNRKGLGRAVVIDHQATESSGGILIAETIEWQEVNTSRVALRERREMTITEDLSANTWSIDWDHTWTSESTVRLGVTSYPEHWWGGYAGLNFRAARSMAAEESIRASGGREGVKAIHGQSADWISIAGRADGAGDDDPDHPATGGVILIAHPDNAWGGRSAYTFSASDEFGFAALAPLMHREQQITPGSPLRLRYRSTVFGEHVDPNRLERFAEAYTSA